MVIIQQYSQSTAWNELRGIWLLWLGVMRAVCVCVYSMCTLLYGDQLLIQPTNQCALSIDFYNSFIE